MNVPSRTCSVTRWLVCLLLIFGVLFAAPAGMGNAVAASQPAFAAEAPVPLVGSLLNDLINDRTRLIQVSFIVIVIGILLLWKK